MKVKLTIWILLLAISNSILAQKNCEAYLYMGDTVKYTACKKAEEIDPYYQFSREFQEILDETIAIDSSFDYAYVEKSVAYLKSGDFLTWKKLMDRAVELNPVGNLGYRGWCRYQFFRDYVGAINDIELLDELADYDIGTSANGDYHLQIVRAICYKALGEKSKAIDIIETQLSVENYFVGKYDYLHLGVLYLEIGEFEKALKSFSNQEELNDLAENQYYIALTFKAQADISAYISRLEMSRELYLEERCMFDPYTHPYDKVYLSEIEKKLEIAYGQLND